MSIPRDVQQFLAGYPDRELDSTDDNFKFYSNIQRCRPDNLRIEEIFTQWFGDYDKLEHKHGFIQWLFPTQEYGMNWDSSPLQPHEIQSMTNDPMIIQRLIKSYRLMLDFYGMRLESEDTGLLSRSAIYADRYRNLTRSSHNNLRISRILKCLSEFGLERFNAGFVLHVLNEQSENDKLTTPVIKSSMDRWWANCLRNTEERKWIQNTIRKVRTHGYVFTRDMYTDVLQRRQIAGSLSDPDLSSVTS